MGKIPDGFGTAAPLMIENPILLVDGDIILKSDPWLSKNRYWMHGDDEYVHRSVASKALGRPLKTTEQVHHVDYDKNNNQRSNLVICNAATHSILHMRTDCLNAGYDPNTHLLCSICKTYHPKEAFAKNAKSRRGFAQSCREKFNEWRKRRGINKNKWNPRAKILQQIRRAKAKARLAEEGRRP